MKKKYIILICIILLFIILFVSSLFLNKDNNNVNNVENVDIKNEVVENKEEVKKTDEELLLEKVDKKLSEMTLREKIGQMLIIAYYDTNYTKELDTLLKEVKPGGFILFEKNVTNYENTVNYISKIKATANIPMIMSIDQEGGRVQKIKNLDGVNVQIIPNMYDLGKTYDTELSYDVGTVIGEELSAFGVNTDFAPILDIFSNLDNKVIGNRAFGNDSNTVISMALPLARGIKNSGVVPVYKHFPGHGDTGSDSHVELPVVSKTKEELYQNELLTFKAAIEDGAEMIMTAHIALPKVTGSYIPATLSKDIVNGILREEMGFDGVVITDAINMKALSDNYSLEQICEYTINAGVDIILMPTDPKDALNIIERLVNNGNVTEDRINESVKRILKLKYKNNMDKEKELNKESIGSQEHIDIINRVNKNM